MSDTTPDENRESVGRLVERLTRTVDDWPQPGVVFRDLTPVLADASAFASIIDGLVGAAHGIGDIDVVVGVESRGFWLGPALALRLGVGFVPVRKPGKLPGAVHSAQYDLEYGRATLELPVGLIQPGQRVVIVDDVLATGGTLEATGRLVREAQADAVAALVLIELTQLGGRSQLAQTPVVSLASY